MSYVQSTEVNCDSCGEWIRVDGGKHEADAVARTQGWRVRVLRSRRGTVHLCPACAKTAAQHKEVQP